MPRARGGVDDGRRPDLGEAVLAGVDVEEPVDQAALERGAGALVDREAGAGDLGAAGVVEDVERLAELPVRLARPGRAAGRRVGADLALDRLVARQQLAPRPDRDVGLLATDRDVGVGRVRDAQEQVVERRLGRRRARRRAPSIRSPAAVDAARSSATSGPSGAAPALIASPIRFEAALRSALSASLSPSSRRRSRVELEGPVDERRVLALVDRALADGVRLVAEPLQPDAHAAPPPCRAAASRSRPMTNVAIEAGEQPAGPRPVRPAEERTVERRERASAASRPPSVGRREDARPARRRRAGGARLAAASASAARIARAAPRRASAASAGSVVAGRAIRARSGAYASSQPRAAPTRSSRIARLALASARLPFSAATRAATSTPGIWTSSARCANAGRNAAASAATSAAGSSSE